MWLLATAVVVVGVIAILNLILTLGVIRRLREHSDLLATPGRDDPMVLTDEGMENARRVVRNHRLWELYLTNAVQFAPDHVHEDADKIEHVLGAETVRDLERRLQFAKRDPHGRLIPGLEDIYPATAGRRA